MHDHDFDLVAGLSIGLDPDGTARRLVESCPDCAAEFARQEAVRDVLGRIPPAVMTDYERRSLRAAVGQELDRGARVLAFPRRWATIGSVAAGVLVLVGVGSVFSQLGGGDDSTAFGTITNALGAASETTAAAAATADGSLAATEMVPAAGEPTRSLDLGEVDMQTFVARLADQADMDEKARAGVDTTHTTAAAITPVAPQPPACLDRITEPGPTVVTAVVDGTPVVAYRPPGEAAFVAFRIADCEPFPLE